MLLQMVQFYTLSNPRHKYTDIRVLRHQTGGILNLSAIFTSYLNTYWLFTTHTLGFNSLPPSEAFPVSLFLLVKCPFISICRIILIQKCLQRTSHVTDTMPEDTIIRKCPAFKDITSK